MLLQSNFYYMHHTHSIEKGVEQYWESNWKKKYFLWKQLIWTR